MGLVTPSTACLAPSPPDLSGPAQTPPVFLLAFADPPVTEVIRAEPDVTIDFTMEFRSEDAGEPLLAALHLDLFTPSSDLVRQSDRIAPGSFDAERLPVELTWRVPSSLSGCHSISMLLTHESNMPTSTFVPIDNSDVALATWWLYVDRGTTIGIETCGGSQ